MSGMFMAGRSVWPVITAGVSIDAELHQVALHLCLHLYQVRFERVDLSLNRFYVNFIFSLESVDVARNVEIEIVLFDGANRNDVCVFLDVLPRLESLDDLRDMLL